MPTFEIDTDQGVFEIDADREPTLEEAQRIISGQTQQAAPAVQRDLSVVPADVRSQVLAEAERAKRGVGERLVAAPGESWELGKRIAGQLWDVAKGGLASVPRAEENIVNLGIGPGTVRNVQATGRAGLEGILGRIPLDIMEFGRQQLVEAARDPLRFQRLISSPEGLIADRLGFGQQPVDISENAMEAAAQEALMRQSVKEARQRGVIPEALRQITDEPIADITPAESAGAEFLGLVAPVPAVGPARIAAGAKGAVRVPGQVLRGTRDVTARAVAESPLLRPVVTGLESRGLRSSVENLGAEVFNIPETGPVTTKFIEAVDTGQFVDDLNEIRKVKTPSNYPELISTGEKTVSNLGVEIDNFVKPRKDLPVNNANAGTSGRGVISELDRRDYPVAVENIEKRAALFDEPITLQRTFDELKQINERVRSYYTKSEAGQATYLDDLEHTADLAMRDQLSANADDLFKGLSGVDRNPFRLYGRINERVSRAEAHYRKIRVGSGRRVVRGGGPVEGISEGVARGLRKGKQVVTGGELDAANANVRRLFQRTPKGGPPIALTPDEATALTQPLTSFPPPIPAIDEATQQALGL